MAMSGARYDATTLNEALCRGGFDVRDLGWEYSSRGTERGT